MGYWVCVSAFPNSAQESHKTTLCRGCLLKTDDNTNTTTYNNNNNNNTPNYNNNNSNNISTLGSSRRTLSRSEKRNFLEGVSRGVDFREILLVPENRFTTPGSSLESCRLLLLRIGLDFPFPQTTNCPPPTLFEKKPPKN